MPKRKTIIPVILKKGELGKYGYRNITSLPSSKRHKALRRAVKSDGYLPILRRLVVIRTFNKNREHLYEIYDDDVKWLQRNREKLENNGRKTTIKKRRTTPKKKTTTKKRRTTPKKKTTKKKRRTTPKKKTTKKKRRTTPKKKRRKNKDIKTVNVKKRGGSKLIITQSPEGKKLRSRTSTKCRCSYCNT